MSDKITLTTDEEIASYGIGRQVGDQIGSNAFSGLVPEAVAQGVADALKGAALAIPGEDINKAFQALQARMQAEQAGKAKTLAAEGEAFLAANAGKKGITVTESGLQYEVLIQGEGDKPSLTSQVRTHYHGTLIDGTVFDSSVNRGQPAEFPVNGVIAGWTEALQMMTVGSKWRLFIPYQLAYGERGAGGAIGPYSALVFEVELLEITG